MTSPAAANKTSAQVTNTAVLELKLNSWVESLASPVRPIIRRGRDLVLPGAANLRLAYLAVRLLLRRMELETERERAGVVDANRSTGLANCYLRARQTAEEIALLAQDLGPEQLGDFWLPGTAFV